MGAEAHPHQHEIDFTVDGEKFTTTDRDQPAEQMLSQYAGLSSTEYELGELRGKNPEPHVFAANDVVHVTPGARFITLRIGPGPVE